MANRDRPVARLAADALRTAIRNGQYAAGDVLDSEHRLAECLGVGRGTVRAAIDLLVSTGELTRRPHARPMVGIAKKRSGSSLPLDIYVWVSHPISDSASLMFIKGVSLGLKGTRYRLVVREPTRFFGGHVPSDERQLLADLLDDDGVAGAIVQRDPCSRNGAVVRDLLQAGKALVFVDSPPPDEIAADYVGTANLVAARECVEHLIEQGHQDVVCLVESDVSEVTQQRVKGYWRAMRQAGIEHRGACLNAGELSPATTRFRPTGRYAARCATHGSYLEWAQRLVAAVLARSERPTALFVGCDVLAYSVGALLDGAGLSIPGDVSLVGFDWLARWESSHLDDLTTASQDFEGFGRHAANLLLDRLSGEAAPAPRHVLLPAPFVVRSSTAPRTVSEPSPDVSGNAAFVKP